MSYKVIRDSSGNMVCFGPNDEHYDPVVHQGCVLAVEDNPPSQSSQQQRDAISTAIQKMLDDKAKSLRYDSILSARSYAGYANPFQAEAIKLANWSANCWATAGNIEAQVNSGVIPMPTVSEALAMMPPYVV